MYFDVATVTKASSIKKYKDYNRISMIIEK